MRKIGRKKKDIEHKELNLAPMLSILVAIIPLLLTSAVFFKIRIFDSSVFPLPDKVFQENGADELPIAYVEFESKNKIVLMVKKGEKVLFKTTKNLKDLNDTLKAATQKYPEMIAIRISSDKNVSYKDLIAVFDMAKQPSIETKQSLFEDVSLDDIFRGS